MKKVLAVIVFAAAATALSAQEARIDAVPCPHPIHTVIKADQHPPTPDPADFGPKLAPLVQGSQWNQTAINKAFGTTFHFPHEGECCVWTRGTLVITIKALQGGPKGSPTSANDGIDIISGGSSVPSLGQPAWPGGATTGQTRIVTINIPANILANGKFSLYVEDDTAVLSATLTLEGCCLRR